MKCTNKSSPTIPFRTHSTESHNLEHIALLFDIHPVALRKTKVVHKFCLSESNRVNQAYLVRSLTAADKISVSYGPSCVI